MGTNGKFAQVSNQQVKQPVQQLAKFGDLLVAQTDQVELYNATTPAALHLIGSDAVSLCYGMNIDAADGDVNRGLWIPMGGTEWLKFQLRLPARIRLRCLAKNRARRWGFTLIELLTVIAIIAVLAPF